MIQTILHSYLWTKSLNICRNFWTYKSSWLEPIRLLKS